MICPAVLALWKFEVMSNLGPSRDPYMHTRVLFAVYALDIVFIKNHVRCHQIAILSLPFLCDHCISLIAYSPHNEKYN